MRAVGVLMMAALVLAGGCEDSSDVEIVGADSPAQPSGETPAVATEYVGTWALYEGSAVQGSPFWYATFNADGTFFISNDADGVEVRVSGTYTVSDGQLVGPFTNPGTGEGRVECSISGGILSMDFIEYWHDPYKHVPYTGEKL